MSTKLYYEDPYMVEFEAQIINLEFRNGRIQVVLDQTAFYPGGGGQPHDVGVLVGDTWKIRVHSVYLVNDSIVHEGPFEGVPKIGSKTLGRIDWNRRYRLMRMHTAAHILGYAIKRVYGLNVGFAGGLLNVNESYDDFNTRIPRDNLPKIEAIVNDVIKQNLKHHQVWVSREEANQILLKYGEKLTELHEGIVNVRIMRINNLIAYACGGTHTATTGEVRGVRILKRESKGAGITRIRYTLID